MVLTHTTGQGIDALDQEQVLKLVDGSYVVRGVTNELEVTLNSGTLGQSDTLQVDTGDAVVEGTTHSFGSTTNVQIDAADPTNPRKDVVYVASGGSISVAKGTANAAQPSGNSRRDTYTPAPSDLSSTAAAPLAEVWVPAGNSSIVAGDISDRRLLSFRQLDVDTVAAEVIGSNYHFAAAYPGGDPDARLDNAISAASAGDAIFLEAATYDATRDITGTGNRGLRLIGVGESVAGNSTVINASWTITTIRVGLENVKIDDNNSGSLQVDGNDCRINNCTGPLTVGGDNVRVLNGYSFDDTITFESGTSGGLVDSYVRTSVTDNGTNTSGDIG